MFTSAVFQLAVAPDATLQNTPPPRSSKSSVDRRATRRDALAAALEKLQVGQPLPSMGTCKHYRHSHRYGTVLPGCARNNYISPSLVNIMRLLIKI